MTIYDRIAANEAEAARTLRELNTALQDTRTTSPLPADRLRAVILDAAGPCIGPDATYELRRLLEDRRVDQ